MQLKTSMKFISGSLLRLLFLFAITTFPVESHSRGGPNGNGGATVHGARARNSSIPLRSVLINQPQSQQDDGSQCEYCQPKDCISEGSEETDEYDEPRVIYCYVERDKETSASTPQVCTKSEPALRRLVIGDFDDLNQMSGCRPSRKSPFHSICWCRMEFGGNGDDSQSNSKEQGHRRSRFNSGRRGGLQVVRLQSAEDSNSKTEPLMGRVRIESAPLINSSAMPSAASKPIARPVIHTIPRRPSPASNYAGRLEVFWAMFIGVVALFSFKFEY
ncbi:hypothetical protein M3Y97_00666600 [Aphelenchoides bicaudatus]|nr:hypothetical protein M3Y97_00666600 [Aphelenchoides bicaudatus]